MMTCMCMDSHSDYAPTILRVWLGVIFTLHGWQKIAEFGVENFAGMINALPMANVLAYVVAYGELIAGMLLIFGLFTHWAAKFAVVIGVFAFALVHMSSGFFIQGATYGYEYVVLWTLVAVSLVMTGGGALSLDSMMKDKMMKKSGMN